MSYRFVSRMFIVGLLIVGFVPAAGAVNLSFAYREGDVRPVGVGTYTGAEDASIFSGFPNENVGQRVNLPIGSTGNVQRVLMRFNEIELLSGFALASAQLNLRLETTDSITRTINVYEVLFSDWVEGPTPGVSGTPDAGDRGVTYNRRNQTNHSPLSGPLWTTAGLGAGTDRGTTILGSITIPGTATVGTPLTINFNAAGRAVIQSWMNGATNTGFFLQSAVESSTGMAFDSAEAVTLANRPQLVLEIAVPEPSTLTLLGLGIATIAFRRRRTNDLEKRGCAYQHTV